MTSRHEEVGAIRAVGELSGGQIADYLPTLRDRARESDRRSRIADETVCDLTRLGVFRMLQPARYGGAEAEILSFFEVVREISSACGSTGWLTALFGVHAWHLALFPTAAQEDVWGAGRDVLLTASYGATGRVAADGSNFRLRGRWRFASGCLHAGWALLGGQLNAEDGSPEDVSVFLVPMSDLRVELDWDTVGLRGTGSHNLIAENVLVPGHRMLSFVDCAHCRTPGQEVNRGALYRLPLPSLLGAAASVPPIGMALGAYRAQVSWIRDRLDRSWSGLSWNTDDLNSARLAAAGADIDASWSQLAEDLRELTRCAETGGEIPLALRRKVRRDQSVATHRAARAVDQFFEHSGGDVLRLGNPVEQAWRNVHAAQLHALNDLDHTLAMYGAGELGVSGRHPMV